jgi:GntR family transcriptional regulator, trigonelline degradation regulator
LIDSHLLVLRPVAPVRAQVVENLRSAIIAGQFEPGERLREKELCELTGTSRTSVREALRQLESEGLIEVIANVGPVVATVSAKIAKDIYQVRGQLEGLAGRLCAEHGTDAQIAKLEAIVAQYAASEPLGSEEQLRLKGTFYDVLLAAADNDEITRMLTSLRARVTALRKTTLSHPGRFQATVRELQEIVAAIKARDPERTDRACHAHVEAAFETALLAFDNDDMRAEHPRS